MQVLKLKVSQEDYDQLAKLAIHAWRSIDRQAEYLLWQAIRKDAKQLEKRRQRDAAAGQERVTTAEDGSK